jgi:hypothetical protein
MVGFLRTTTSNAFSSLNIASCRPQIKYQERSAMERELKELYIFLLFFPE